MDSNNDIDDFAASLPTMGPSIMYEGYSDDFWACYASNRDRSIPSFRRIPSVFHISSNNFSQNATSLPQSSPSAHPPIQLTPVNAPRHTVAHNNTPDSLDDLTSFAFDLPELRPASPTFSTAYGEHDSARFALDSHYLSEFQTSPRSEPKHDKAKRLNVAGQPRHEENNTLPALNTDDISQITEDHVNVFNSPDFSPEHYDANISYVPSPSRRFPLPTLPSIHDVIEPNYFQDPASSPSNATPSKHPSTQPVRRPAANPQRRPLPSLPHRPGLRRRIRATAADLNPPTHGRPQPYAPTLQRDGHYPRRRGNPPPGISDNDWDKAFNNANSVVWTRAPPAQRGDVAKTAREDGRLRDIAIEKFIKLGELPADFVDSNP